MEKRAIAAAERSGTCITLFEEERVYIGVGMSEIGLFKRGFTGVNRFFLVTIGVN